MSEAAQTLINAYFIYARGQELTSDTFVEHAASCWVLEKCGFVGNGCGRWLFSARRGAVRQPLPAGASRLEADAARGANRFEGEQRLSENDT